MSRIHNLFQVFSPRVWKLLALAFCLFLLPVLLFVALADEVRERDTLGFDEAALRSINGYSSPQLDAIVVSVTDLGGFVGVTVLTLGLILLLWQRGMRRRAATVAVGVGGAALINVILKAFFQRDRPQLWERLVTESSYSFPSGHAMASSALAFAFMIVLWHTKWRWYAVVIGVMYIVAIGLTRLYLGVHYPTDVLAGWMVSGAWLIVVAGVLKYRRQLFQVIKNVRTIK